MKFGFAMVCIFILSIGFAADDFYKNVIPGVDLKVIFYHCENRIGELADEISDREITYNRNTILKRKDPDISEKIGQIKAFYEVMRLIKKHPTEEYPYTGS